MDWKELKIFLKSSDSRSVTKALTQMRSKDVKTESGLQNLLEQNFISLLVPILERSNKKNIDISLSILANLLQSPVAQTQIRTSGGLTKLVSIVDNIQDRGIQCRGWRAVANACQDRENLSVLTQANICVILSRAMRRADSSDTDTLTVLVRCVRICCPAEFLVEDPSLAESLVSLLKSEDTDLGLLKAVTKCVAKLSHGASVLQSHSLMAAAPRLVQLAEAESSSKVEIVENSLGTLINLSQLDAFRPGLGAAGVVELLVRRHRTGGREDTSVDEASVVRSLCLYCRESVNRVRMREGGGCAVLVSVLAQPQHSEVRDTVLRSLLQFLYDNHSLNVLMSEGLVPCLINMLDKHMEDTDMKHLCTEEKAVNHEDKSGDKKYESEDANKEDESNIFDLVGEEINLSDGEEEEDQEMRDNDLEDGGNDDSDKASTVSTGQKVIPDDCSLKDDNRLGAHNNPQPGPSGVTRETSVTSVTSVTREAPVFRITSPSYQAVQYELEQFMALKSSWESAQAQAQTYSPAPSSLLGSYSPLAPSSPPGSFSPVFGDPGSPSSSVCHSPDQSPPQIYCGYSPARSPDCHNVSYSPLLYSPSYSASSPEPEPSYSPVENFSDTEEESQDAQQDLSGEAPASKEEIKDKSGNDEKVAININPCVQTTAESSSSNDPTSFDPWTKRSIRIQRTTTFLGQTFVLPAKAREGTPPLSPTDERPSKRPRMASGPQQKYISSLNLSPRKPPAFSRQSSRSSVASEASSCAEPQDRVSWILQILSRLSQADRPHADLTSRRTVHTLLKFLSRLPNSEVCSSKAAKILTRLTTNLHCLFPFLLARHITHFMLFLEDLTEGCDQCENAGLRTLLRSVSDNVTLLAETGFGEGEICHRLVHPGIEKEDKQSIVISAALLVRQRKMLQNILLRHDTLDTLLDTLEGVRGDAGEQSDIVRDCVYSLSQLTRYLGVACDDLSVSDVGVTECRRSETDMEDDLTLVCDDESEIRCNKSVICEASSVFAAMLAGSFKESDKTRIRLRSTSSQSLTCLVHFLYTCNPDTCPQFSNLQADTLIELVTQSDKYLLGELNLWACHSVLRHCHDPGHVGHIYRDSIQSNFPVIFGGRQESLSRSLVTYILVTDFTNKRRVGLVMAIVKESLTSHLLHDINHIIRPSLQLVTKK